MAGTVYGPSAGNPSWTFPYPESIRRRPAPKHLPVLVVVAIATIVLPACGGGGGGSGRDEVPAGPAATGRACDPVVVDPLDPRSTQHLLPGAPAPAYADDPPTSGPHLAGGAVSGSQTAPLEAPVQVAVLEEGGILVQYRPTLGDKAQARLISLLADKVVLAPNPALPRPVIATAWRHRLACRSVDLASLRTFIAERKGRGPG